MQLIGYKKISGTVKENGKPYSGYGLNFQYEDSKLEEGVAVSYIYVGSTAVGLTPIVLGAEYVVNYNQYQKVQSLIMVESVK